MILPTYVLYHTIANYMLTGHFPQVFQKKRWLYRAGNYNVQCYANANPDNFWDGRHFCWTTDPGCGLEIGPKRPWEDLKDPKKNLENKLNRDVNKSMLLAKNGYKGF